MSACVPKPAVYPYSRSPDGNMVSFRYYLLGGDTVVPSGLLARLCHAFLV